MPIHDDIRQQVEKEMNAYKKAKVAYEMMGKERAKAEIPEMTLNRMFLISGNNTGTGILQNIMDNNGTGLICETEADTISTAIGSEYGHWSETLRRAFDHDWLAYNRRTNQEYRENKKSYLSLLLSGTPAQVRALIPSAENGLFSRQLFYYMHGIYTWADQFACGEIDLDEIFRSIGRDWQLKLDILKEHGYENISRIAPENKDFNEDLKERNGIKPLKAVPHRRKDLYYETVSDLQYFKCNPDRLIDRLSKTFKNGQYRYLAEYALAGSAFFIGRKDEEIMYERLKAKMSEEYRAYSDKGKLYSKQEHLKRAYQSVMKDLRHTQARTKEQIIHTAKSLYELADCAVRCEVEQELSSPQITQEETPQMEEPSEALCMEYG